MIDIISYWISVSLVCAFALYGVVLTLMFLFDLWVEHRVTNGKVKNFTCSKLPKWLKDGFDDVNPFVIAPFIASWFLVAFIVIVIDSPRGVRNELNTVLDVVNYLALGLTPYMSYVVLVGVLLFSLDWVSRKGYILTTRINSLLEKEGRKDD